MNMDTILPLWVVIILAAGVGIGLGGLGLWVGCAALEKLVRLIRRTLAAEARIQHRWRQRESEALNMWIRDSFRNKRNALAANGRANQEHRLRVQIAEAADAMQRRATNAQGCA